MSDTFNPLGNFLTKVLQVGLKQIPFLILIYVPLRPLGVIYINQ